MRQCSGRCFESGYNSSWNQKQCKLSWMEQPWILPREWKDRTQPSLKVIQQLEKEVWVTTGQVLVEMHVTDWAAAQKENSKLDAVLQWLESKKKIDLRTLLGECIMSKEGQMVWRICQNFITLRGTLYLHSTPKGRMRIFYSSLYPKYIKLPP